MLRGVERAMAARKARDPARFFDVRFADLVRDPAGVVGDLVRHFDLRRAADHDAKVAAYLATERSDGRGRHHYDGRMYGLDPDRIRDRYGAYTTAFLRPEKAA
jgi:hypothetical protein